MTAELLPSVSVVIPVFNQTAELARCLGAIERQTYERSRFDVVVVDNGSAAPLQDVVEAFSWARYEREERPGSYAARNRGVELTGGDIVAFTDADCEPAEDWIASGVRAVRSLGGPGMVGGRIELAFSNPQRLTAAELYESVFGFPQELYVAAGFAATANMFTTRETFQRVGAFDARLMSNGDKEWGRRLQSAGLRQIYADDVVVAHPSRRTLGELLRKTARVAGGFQQLAERDDDGVEEIWRHAWRHLVKLRLIRHYLPHDRLQRPADKAKFAATAWVVDLVRIAERLRVYYGGAARRR